MKKDPSYWQLTAAWKAQYLSKPKGEYNPASIRLAKRAKTCAKCDSTWARQLHHKGSEFFFAKNWPDWYAERYIQFHPDDVVTLCYRCHRKIHKMYKNIMRQLHIYLEDRHAQITGVTVEMKELEKFRFALVRFCDRWIKRGKIKKPSRHMRAKLNKELKRASIVR